MALTTRRRPTARRTASRMAALSLVGLTAVGGVTVGGCKGGRFGNQLSKGQEVQLGQEAAVDIERQNKVVTSGPEYDRLQRIAARILPLARRDYDVPYTVKLIDSKEINAFALPGGPIYFYKGLVNLTDTDDQLASVVGHEAAHVVKRHSAKQISDAQTKGALASILLGGSGQLAQTAAGLALQLQQLRFSRDDEGQSDEVGFQYLVEAGYDPDGMAQMFRKLGEKGGGGGPEWLASHPVTNKRVEAAERRAAAYKQQRQSAAQ